MDLGLKVGVTIMNNLNWNAMILVYENDLSSRIFFPVGGEKVVYVLMT